MEEELDAEGRFDKLKKLIPDVSSNWLWQKTAADIFEDLMLERAELPYTEENEQAMIGKLLELYQLLQN